MKKKGFTLVELLAVIAILAILVIVAMPNVLGMFNQAKSSTFVTEVQTYLDVAKTNYVANALESTGGMTFYHETATPTLFSGETENKLDMDGADKSYKIVISAAGKITSVIIWDGNFCYSKTGTDITKDQVSKNDLRLGAATKTGDSATVGCNGAAVTE